MNESDILRLLKSFRAVVASTHVCLTPKVDGWYHSNVYVTKDRITKHPWKAQPLYRSLALDWFGSRVEVVASPVIGAVAIAQFIALYLSEREGRDVLVVYAELENQLDKASPFKLARGFNNDVRGRRVLVVDDVLMTGYSAQRTVTAVKEAGGEVIGVAALVNRGNVKEQDLGGVPRVTALTNLAGIHMKTWKASLCPLCKQLAPLRVDIGQAEAWLKTSDGLDWLSKGGIIAEGFSN